MGRRGEAHKPPRNHILWLGPGRGDGRTWVQEASRHFCLFTLTRGSSVDKAARCSNMPGASVEPEEEKQPERKHA